MSFTKIFISERGFISPRSALVLVFLIFSLVTASALQAKPNKPVQTKKSPLIEAAMIMYEDELSVAGCTGTFDTLTIVGANLMPDDGSETTVTLATYAPLTLCAATIEELIVALPPNSAPGDYLLSVATADGVATYDLTVGAVGPQGLKGEQGDKGDKGDKGELPEPQFPVLSRCPCWRPDTAAEMVATVDKWYAEDVIYGVSDTSVLCSQQADFVAIYWNRNDNKQTDIAAQERLDGGGTCFFQRQGVVREGDNALTAEELTWCLTELAYVQDQVEVCK